MNYEDFKQQLIETLNENKPDEVLKYVLRTARRTNDNQADTITMIYGDISTLSPIFYVKDYYLEYEKDSMSVEKVVEKIIDESKNNFYKDRVFDIHSITPEKAKSSLVLKLYNYAWNKEIIESCAHVNCLDLAAVPVWNISLPDENRMFVVDKFIQRNLLRMTDEEVLQIAMRNTFSDTYKLQSLQEMIKECVEDIEDLYLIEMFPDENYSFVLTNGEGYLGANALVSQNIMRKVYEEIGEECFVMPSSIHETIIMKGSYVESPEMLQDIVKQVNSTVRQDELLSDNVYRFNGSRLQICNTLDEWRRQKEQELPMQYGRNNRRVVMI